jgi:hypothetical protein
MITKTYNFLDRNSVKVIDTCATLLLLVAGLLFADNLGTLFFITMALLLLQEIVRTDNIFAKRFSCMIIFGLLLTILTVLSVPIVTAIKLILQLFCWAN